MYSILHWHEGVKPAGRPTIDHELEQLILRLAKENPRWGCGKIHRELLKLGFQLSETTIRHVLKRHGNPPVPQRGANTWRAFLNHYKDQMLACDFFTVETIFLQTPNAGSALPEKNAWITSSSSMIGTSIGSSKSTPAIMDMNVHIKA